MRRLPKLWAWVWLASVGCSEGGVPARPAPPSAVSVDRAESGRGVPALRDAAVLAIDVAGERLCTGVLVEEDIVVTARHCVSLGADAIPCPSNARQIEGDRDPARLRVFVGTDVTSARFVGAGVEIVAPPTATLCAADIAFLILDRAVEGVEPVTLDTGGIARGEFVRTLGFGQPADARGPIKLEREHLAVVAATDREFLVAVEPLEGDSGGPAFDESSGKLVGVLSRATAGDAGTSQAVYTRVDAFADLSARAIDQALLRRTLALDGGTLPKPKAKPKPKAVSSVGAPCTRGDDCATRICVAENERQYCTRRCSTGDRCPAGYRCKSSGEGSESLCLVKP